VLNHEEHPEQAARRILREQAGIEPPQIELSHVESFGNGAWHLVFHFVADLDEPATVRSGDNVAEIAWFGLDALPDPEDMAHHGWGLDVIEEIRAGAR
jgi:ADP-ribose pyrophosphatase YjhB (NUDIX family)